MSSWLQLDWQREAQQARAVARMVREYGGTTATEGGAEEHIDAVDRLGLSGTVMPLIMAAESNASGPAQVTVVWCGIESTPSTLRVSHTVETAILNTCRWLRMRDATPPHPWVRST